MIVQVGITSLIILNISFVETVRNVNKSTVKNYSDPWLWNAKMAIILFLQDLLKISKKRSLPFLLNDIFKENKKQVGRFQRCPMNNSTSVQ